MEYETRCFSGYLHEDGIIRCKVKPKADIDLLDAEENTLMIDKISGGIKRSLLVDLKEIGSISKPARDHLANNGNESKILRVAILVESPLSKMIANLFIGFSNPVAETKLFTEENKALTWLAQKLPPSQKMNLYFF